ncbi:hypothetical protein OFN64_34010, partial [Escherichia coli]|nr:hypothetical protein [Escherichia coli]
LDAPLKINSQHIIVSLISVATFVFFTTIGLNHEEGEAYGWMSLLPTALVLVVALTTHRTVEALFSGAIAGVLLLNPTEAVEQIVDIS